jgi:sugar lactone lactonase YvrE
MLLKILQFILLLPAVCLFYLLVWPVEIDPVAWDAPIAPAMESSFAKNNFLKNVEILGLNDGIGPEDVAIDDNGNMYAGYDDGRIIKYDKTGNRIGVFVETFGRPLGMRFDLDGNLIIADAVRGLIKVDMQGTLTVLATESDGIPLKFTDDLDIANDGKIYFSDASTRYGIG